MAVGFLCAAVAGSRGARAQAPVVDVDIHDAPGCAGRDRFDALLDARTRGLRLPDGVTLRIDVSAVGRNVVGVLTIATGRGAPGLRSFEAASCDAVLDALALGAALAFVPDRAEGSLSGPSPTPSTAVHAAPREATYSSSERSGDAADRARLEARRWRWSAGAHVEVLGLVPGAPVAAVPLFLGVGREGGPWAPALRLWFVHTGAGLEVGPATATLRWTSGRVEGCPLAATLAPRLAVRPCATVELGALSASAAGLADARTATRPWAAASVAARLTWRPIDLLLVEADLGLGVPLIRDTFALAPSTDLYRAPAVVPSGGVGLAAVLP